MTTERRIHLFCNTYGNKETKNFFFIFSPATLQVLTILALRENSCIRNPSKLEPFNSD